MKKSAVLLSCFLLTLWCPSQNIMPEDFNFKLNENKKVIWEMDFNYEAKKDSLVITLQNFLKKNFFTSELSLKKYHFFGQSNKVLLSSTKKMAVGARNPYKANIEIEVMDGNYTVTLTDIVFDGMQFDYPILGKKSVGASQIYLEDFVVKHKKPEFRSNEGVMSQLRVLNKDFINYFTMKHFNN